MKRFLLAALVLAFLGGAYHSDDDDNDWYLNPVNPASPMYMLQDNSGSWSSSPVDEEE